MIRVRSSALNDASVNSSDQRLVLVQLRDRDLDVGAFGQGAHLHRRQHLAAGVLLHRRHEHADQQRALAGVMRPQTP